MAYGTSAGVTLLIGGTNTGTFTASNITAAIAMGDTWVDKINSSAVAARKTLASNIIAAEVLKKGSISNKLKGLSSDGGHEGRPARAGFLEKYVPQEAIDLLSTKPRSTFTVASPQVTGEW